MKYYSENLKRLFDTPEELEKEENEVLEAEKRAKEEQEKLQAERKARAEEVAEARKAMIEAQKNYEKILTDFIRDYKTYHYSTTTLDDIPRFFTDFFLF